MDEDVSGLAWFFAPFLPLSDLAARVKMALHFRSYSLTVPKYSSPTSLTPIVEEDEGSEGVTNIDKRLRRTSHVKSASVPLPSPPPPRFPPGLPLSPPAEPVLRRSKPIVPQAAVPFGVGEPLRKDVASEDGRTKFRFQASFIDFRSDSSEAEDISPVVKAIVARKASRRSSGFSQRPLSADSSYSTNSVVSVKVQPRPRSADGPRENDKMSTLGRVHRPTIPHMNSNLVLTVPTPLGVSERAEGKKKGGEAEVSLLLKSRLQSIPGDVVGSLDLEGFGAASRDVEMLVEEEDLTTIDLGNGYEDFGSISAPSSSSVRLVPEPKVPPGLGMVTTQPRPSKPLPSVKPMVLISPESPLAVGGAKLRDGVSNISWPSSHYPPGEAPHGAHGGYVSPFPLRGAQVRASDQGDGQGFLWALLGCLRPYMSCVDQRFGDDGVYGVSRSTAGYGGAVVGRLPAKKLKKRKNSDDIPLLNLR
ncbi:hypothetical protein FA15DRAFT_710764 [Coprinopsis marcescibilis]|uniref:Uncharacterized protein n=1 Tax=Coprinopsis marcescibilis TaxID=230819 RepID=A0A5C3KC21_COPMA|nr:hypothetical protein FA15DRAFT_710764 [Coprinopsis marcescibilis]